LGSAALAGDALLAAVVRRRDAMLALERLAERVLELQPTLPAIVSIDASVVCRTGR
jgi:hypothetical protein